MGGKQAVEYILRSICGGIFRVYVQGMDGRVCAYRLYVVDTRILYEGRERYSKSGVACVLRIRVQ